MYHSITIGVKNTWDDWSLIPTSKPIVNPPSVKEKFIEIPGRQGLLDLTELLTGGPMYGNRQGSWDFYVMVEKKNNATVLPYSKWSSMATAYTTIMQYLHGKEHSVILEDDSDYSYNGRLKVSAWKPTKDYPVITIDYNLEPYKTHRTNLTQTL